MPENKKKKKNAISSTPSQSGGVTINANKVDVGGHVVGGNMTTTSQEVGGRTRPQTITKNDIKVHSAWANGLFYLFAFVVVIGVVAWLAGTLNPIVLGIVVVTGIVVVPLIGALQLFMDKRLKEKSFMALMRLVIRQLPIISSITKLK